MRQKEFYVTKDSLRLQRRIGNGDNIIIIVHINESVNGWGIIMSPSI